MWGPQATHSVMSSEITTNGGGSMNLYVILRRSG
jgi:hypothetical protein